MTFMQPNFRTQIRRYGYLKFIAGTLLYAAATVLLYSPILVFFT